MRQITQLVGKLRAIGLHAAFLGEIPILGTSYMPQQIVTQGIAADGVPSFQRFTASLRECRRVLRPGGVVCLRAGTSEQSGNYAYVPLFPTARKIIQQSLPSKSLIEAQFTTDGFAVAAHELVSSEVGENWSAYADKVAYRADSILVQLPDHEFAEGLTALRTHASKAKGAHPVVEPVDFFVFRA